MLGGSIDQNWKCSSPLLSPVFHLEWLLIIENANVPLEFVHKMEAYSSVVPLESISNG